MKGFPSQGALCGCGGPHPALSLPFSSLTTAASIFSLKEIQLQKDPGYRGLAFQQPGRGSCLPHPLLGETGVGCSSLLKNRVGNQHGLPPLASLRGAHGEQGRGWFPYLLPRLPPPVRPLSAPTADTTLHGTEP